MLWTDEFYDVINIDDDVINSNDDDVINSKNFTYLQALTGKR